jgi:hypothetical protein
VRLVLLFVAICLLTCVRVVECAETTLRFERVAERMVQAINKRDYKAVGQDFARGMQEALPEEKAKAFLNGLLNELGDITKLGTPRFNPPNQAVFPAHFDRGIMDLKLVLDRDDKIIGLWFLPHVADIPVLDRNKTPLSLPFKGRWLVQWGGDTKELNQHHDVPNQRFAFDFLGVGDDGKTRKGDGTKNEDYYAFAREVVAPAEGIVTDVIEGARDNVPGSMNSYSALGNAVFIQHSEYEVSVIAHLKLGSATVKRGQKVKRGEVIGLCGNSGNSSEPHIHYHLMNTPIIQDATGIKVFFEKAHVERHTESGENSEYSPLKGDVLWWP